MSLPIVAEFDEILRLLNVLHDGASEPEFLRFILSVDDIRVRLSEAQKECERLMRELQDVNSTRTGLERKLDSARQMLDMNKRKRVMAETKVNDLENQLAEARDSLRDEQKRIHGDRQGLAAHCDRSSGGAITVGGLDSFCRRLCEPDGGLSRISEALDSTGSLISELGYTRSGDELDISRMRSPGHRKRRRSSFFDAPEGVKKTRSTVVGNSFGRPKDINNLTPKECRIPMTNPVTPTHDAGTGPSSGEQLVASYQVPVAPFHPKPISILPNSPITIDSDDSVICDDVAGAPLYPSPAACHSGMNLMACDRLNNRTHLFCQKTMIRAETCEPCGKRCRFGKIAAKCRDCRATVHLECKDQLPLPCVPASCTPIAKGQSGVLSDYTPSLPPMIPALIVYCVNEIEARGLKEVGIYRISGSEREIKTLKEKFLRGRGAPNLSNIDIHVICGTVKDFLRSLREPLVTLSLLSDFLRCLEIAEESEQQGRLYQVVADLPRPNRDTMAFMILHLQRVSDCPVCKMPVDSLAKVFGPTIVGYSSINLDPATMLLETMKQVAVMQLMMKTPSSYWACYVNCSLETFENRTPETRGFSSSDSSPATFQKTGFFSGPIGTFKLNKRGKFFNYM